MKRDSREQEKTAGTPEVSGTERQQIVDLDFVRALIAAVDESGIDSLEIARAGTRIRVSKSAPPSPHSAGAATPAPQAAQGTAHLVSHPAPASIPEPGGAPAAPASNLLEVKSPMVGTFYRASAPDAPNYVELGSRIAKGQTLCILEAMKLMNELESEVEGVVREICVGNAEPVEFGQVLFRIEPDS